MKKIWQFFKIKHSSVSDGHISYLSNSRATSCLMGRKTSLFSPPPSPLCLQVYHLASVRLRDLCWKLDISSDLRGKIWTCFEHTLIQCTELMKGRHLDQLLLCSVYIMSKVRKQTTNWNKRPEFHHPACQFARSHKVRWKKNVCLKEGNVTVSFLCV